MTVVGFGGTGGPPPYTVRTVKQDGTPITNLTLASFEQVTRTLNQPDTATFVFPKAAYTAAEVPVLGTPSFPVEVQIHRTATGDLIFWGPVLDVSAAGSDGAVRASCAGVDWWLNKTVIDGTVVNALTNGSFEGSNSSWTASGCTATNVSSGKVLGTNAAQLVGTTTGADAFLRQTISASGDQLGNLLTLAGWFQIVSITGEALDRRGLYVEGVQSGVSRINDYYAIDTATPTGVWERAEVTIWIPPNETWNIDVRCYAPNGTILWDAIELVAMQSVSTAGLTGTVTGEADIAAIIGMIVDHVQNPAVGKFNHNILKNLPDTGTRMAKHYQYADKAQTDSALREYIERDDGIDYWIAYTDVSRTFTIAPKKGTDRTGTVTLTYGGNMADYRWRKDGSATVTAATFLGDGDGPDREEGHARDTSFIGGPVLQEVRQSPPKTTIASLEPLAQGRINLLANPPVLLDVDIVPTVGITNVVVTGDVVNVAIADGYTQVAEPWRIVALHEVVSGLVTATLNREP